MHGRSAKSLQTLLDATSAAVAAGVDADPLADELFAVACALDARHALRRALTEPWIEADAQSQLLSTLFGDKVSADTLKVADVAVRDRWSRPDDLGDALETAAVTALVAKADEAGRLDDVEDDLFRFSRILDGAPDLREVLSDQASPLDGKRAVLKTLLEGKVGEETVRLLDQAVVGRHRSLAIVLQSYQQIAAARREKLVATAWVASMISEEHKDRLTAALTQHYDRPVHLNVIVEPSVLGGVRVAIGDEVIDSTVETRLGQAHRRLDR